MPERLKDIYFTPDSLAHMAAVVREAFPAFDPERFLGRVHTPEWADLGLMERMRHVTRCLAAGLPAGYAHTLDLLRDIAPRLRGLETWVLPDYVEQFGQDDWARSLPAMRDFTVFASAEFAIRPFLHRDPERAMAEMQAWARDPHPAVRRLASEGCRPRLPWGMALPKFKADPAPVLAVLELLKDDPDENVRRSVANNLNDISKDNPDVVLAVAERWQGHSPQTDWIIRHACRGLLKKGNRRALKLFGLATPAGRVKAVNLALARKRVPLGGDVVFGFDLLVGGRMPSVVRLEYAIEFARPSGRASRKVFKLSEKPYAPGEYHVQRKHSLADRSTRKHYPGVHRLALIANGVEHGAVEFEVVRPRPAK